MAQTPSRAGPSALTTTTATKYTAPSGAGTWAIVRSVVLVNTSTATAKATVGIGTSNADSASKRIISELSVNPGETIDYPGLFVVLAGGATPDLIFALADTASAITLTLSVVEGP